MNRGSGRLVPLDPAFLDGFNEAPIHESGKSSTARPGPPRTSGFNEAPIHESGKYGVLHVRRVVVRRASMRPRFMNRGSSASRLRTDQRLDASMRPRFMNRGSRIETAQGSERSQCFNEAPIHESGKCV